MRNVRKSFEKDDDKRPIYAVANVSLDIYEDEIFGK